MKQAADVALYSYSKREPKGSSIAIEEKLSAAQEDEILDSYPQLIDEKYRGYFINKLRRIGKKKFTNLADRALKYGHGNKQKLFVHLIK